MLGENMVQMGAFVIVEISRARLVGIKISRQLHHVVAVARFAGLLGNVARNGTRCLKIFPISVAADHIAVVTRHCFPKKARCLDVPRLAGEFMQPRQTDQLWNLGVGMDMGEAVFAAAQGLQDFAVINGLVEREPAPVPGAPVKLSKTLVETAVLATQHLLDLRVVERVEDAADVAAEPLRDSKRARAAAVLMSLEQSRHQLVSTRSEEHTSELQSRQY